MADEQKRERDGDPLRDGIRTVAGVLGALKDAIEDSFEDLRERGDLTPERAKEAARATVRKAQESFEDVRERVDFVSRKEFDALRDEVAALRARLDLRDVAAGADAAAEATGGSPPPGGSAGGRGFAAEEG
jgi:polyhydroxyalkanoate synthesis regulator phasin